jgi:endonuclease/exonuclease/phosphatase family metal-dependent hydrolase
VGGRLAGPWAGVGIVEAHLTYAGTEQRRAQAEALAAIADGLGTPVIVAGDFNAPIEAPDMRTLASTFDDAFAQVGVPAGDPRRASCGPHRIDHLLIRGLRATACTVYRGAGEASDHLPVVATFEIAAPGD